MVRCFQIPSGVSSWTNGRSITMLFLLWMMMQAAAAASFNSRPNIVVVLTDDLDQTLGGWKASTLVKTRSLIANQGMVLPNWFAQTPVCCPSRAELLTGRYFHNLWTLNPTEGGCMHVDVQDKNTSKVWHDYYFAQYFAKLNYTVGVFGKHLNSNNPTDFIPNGVDTMLINGGGHYHNPDFTWATRASTPPEPVKFDNCTNPQGEDEPCYTTAVVGNSSLAWIRRHLAETTTTTSTKNKQPFFALISVKAPHVEDGPGFPASIPAPWYENATLIEQRAPRTLNYNQSCLDHHWLVRNQQPLTTEQGDHIDALYQSRLRTLLSVDDVVEELITTLADHNVLDNTYVVFTSDNGYRLGQFRMPCCKLNPYEDDIRIPMMIRGPGIVPFTTRSDVIGTHVDLMPTLLGLATTNRSSGDQEEQTSDLSAEEKDDPRRITLARDEHGANDVPRTMDGRNLADRLLHPTPLYPATRLLLIEYKSLGDVVRYEHLVDTFNHTFVALRILDSAAPVGFQNIKYVQYRDSRVDWNSTHHPLEQELFDLDLDPYEMANLVAVGAAVVSADANNNNGGGDYHNGRGEAFFLSGLSTMLHRMEQCQGQRCREEEANLGFYYAELVHQTINAPLPV